MIEPIEYRYIDREKSWLAFNARVLQEAADNNVPLLDRLRFLGIFSNNLDEFFRVRFAAIRRLSHSGVSGEKVLGGISSQQLVKDITEIVIQQQSESLRILSIIESELEKDIELETLSGDGKEAVAERGLEEAIRILRPMPTAIQLAEAAKKAGDAPDIVRDPVTKVTLFDYSDIIGEEE